MLNPLIWLDCALARRSKSETSLCLIKILASIIVTLSLILIVPRLESAWAYFTDSSQLLFSITTGFWPTPTPSQSGTSLEAEKSAEGFWEQIEGVDRTGVRGSVCVMNTGEVPTEDLAILDVVQVKLGSNQFVDYVTTSIDLSAHPQLEPGEYDCYPYEIEFLPISRAKYRNVARVTIANHSGWLPGGNNCPGPEPCPFGPEPNAGFKLPGPRGEEGAGIAGIPPGTPFPAPTTAPTLVPHPTGTPVPTGEDGSPPEPTATETSAPAPTQSLVSQSTPTLAPTAEPDPGCTHSAAYWQAYPNLWPVKTLRLGDRDYSKAQALEILAAPPGSDASLDLARQAIAARLNGESGADVGEVLDSLAAADAWLSAHPPGSLPAEPARSEGVALAAYLESFNLGLTGPGLCAGELPTQAPTLAPPTWTPTPTATAVAEDTDDPAPTDTGAPTETPLPTETPFPTEMLTPTLAPTPTQEPTPTDLPPTPTETPASAP